MQRINTPVSVNLIYNHKLHSSYPRFVVWDQRIYPILKIGLHHTVRRGKTLYHIFSVTTKTLFLRLILNTETLSWTLEEIAPND